MVSVFPSRESYLRLITTYLMEYTEDWELREATFNRINCSRLWKFMRRSLKLPDVQ